MDFREMLSFPVHMEINWVHNTYVYNIKLYVSVFVGDFQ